MILFYCSIMLLSYCRFTTSFTRVVSLRRISLHEHFSSPASIEAVSDKSETKVDLSLPSNEDNENLLRIRHTSAHVMAMAVQRLYPSAKVTIGPWIDNGYKLLSRILDLS